MSPISALASSASLERLRKSAPSRTPTRPITPRYTPPDGAVYLIDHTGFIYLMGRSGEYLGFFPPGTTADRMVEIITAHLGQRE